MGALCVIETADTEGGVCILGIIGGAVGVTMLYILIGAWYVIRERA